MAGGRPTKFTKERRDAIIESIGNRIPYILAAQANGICEETLYDWLRQGCADQKAGIDSEFAQFSEAVKQIEVNLIKNHLITLNNMPERWQAQAWILERRWWKHFSSKAADIDFDKRLGELERKRESETVDGSQVSLMKEDE